MRTQLFFGLLCLGMLAVSLAGAGAADAPVLTVQYVAGVAPPPGAVVVGRPTAAVLTLRAPGHYASPSSTPLPAACAAATATAAPAASCAAAAMASSCAQATAYGYAPSCAAGAYYAAADDVADDDADDYTDD